MTAYAISGQVKAGQFSPQSQGILGDVLRIKKTKVQMSPSQKKSSQLLNRSKVPSCLLFICTPENPSEKHIPLWCAFALPGSRKLQAAGDAMHRDFLQKRIGPIRKNCKSFQTYHAQAGSYAHSPNLSLSLGWK